VQVRLHIESMGHKFACGVTTGDLLCACVGSAVRREYTMFGDAINLSARLMCKAKAGLGIILTENHTHDKASTMAEYSELPKLPLKGRSEAILVRDSHLRTPLQPRAWAARHNSTLARPRWRGGTGGSGWQCAQGSVGHTSVHRALRVRQCAQVYSVDHLRNCDYAVLIAQTIAGDKQARPDVQVMQHRHLVGREVLLSALRAGALRAVQDHVLSLVLITGDAGLGKTRLLQHMLDREELQGYRPCFWMCMASCAPELSPMPLTPWRLVLVVRARPSAPGGASSGRTQRSPFSAKRLPRPLMLQPPVFQLGLATCQFAATLIQKWGRALPSLRCWQAQHHGFGASHVHAGATGSSESSACEEKSGPAHLSARFR
jgi:Adenylate and Guanylate cyclase catalytic domain